MAGKGVLIKSILQAIPVYAMSCFKIPLSLCRKLHSLVSNFWWSSAKEKRNIYWLRREIMHKPKSEGGFGFKDFGLFNDALLAKQAWRLASCPELLVSQIFKAKYYPLTNFSEAHIGRRPSWAWRSILSSRHLMFSGVDEVSVHEGLGHSSDTPFKFSVRKTYDYLLSKASESERNSRGEPSDTSKLKSFWHKVWRVKAQEKVKILIWRVYHNAIPSAMNMAKRGCDVNTRCTRCGFKQESSAHIFLECWWVVEFWRLLLGDQIPLGSKFESMADWLWLCVEKFSREALCLIFYGVRWIWFARNKLWHSSIFISVSEAVSKTKATALTVLNPSYKFVVSSEEAALSWLPPDQGVIKVNCDGSWDPIGKMGGYGVICRDCEGQVILVEAGLLDDVGGIVEAEGVALLKGMQVAERMKCSRAVFAIDNAEVLLDIQKASGLKGAGVKWRCACQDLLSQHEDWRLEHVLRDANSVADCLAHRACSFRWSWSSTDALPICIGQSVRKDSLLLGWK